MRLQCITYTDLYYVDQSDCFISIAILDMLNLLFWIRVCQICLLALGKKGTLTILFVDKEIDFLVYTFVYNTRLSC